MDERVLFPFAVGVNTSWSQIIHSQLWCYVCSHRPLKYRMKIRSKKLLFAGASSLCFCLLIFSLPVAASETDEAAEPVNAAVTDTQANREKADK